MTVITTLVILNPIASYTPQGKYRGRATPAAYSPLINITMELYNDGTLRPLERWLADDRAGGGQLLHDSDVLFTRAQRRGRRVGLGVCQRFDYVPEGVVGMT